ncbi:MAG: DUF2975 domain-containing protein [Kineosporiaceae bacterium]|nr:DUF2975 domain-containing protein [Kineosporiaceae bacterium]
MKTPQSTSTPKDRLAFDRWDRLGLAALLALVALAAIARSVVQPLAAWARGQELTVPYVSSITVPPLDAVGTRYGEGRYDLRLDDPTTTQRLIDLAPGLLLLVLILTACWLVFRLMRDIGRGEPFAPRNVARLRLLAAVLALGVPVEFVARGMSTMAMLSNADLGSLNPAGQVELPWLSVLAGMCLALLAEAFKAGSRLRDDVEGLV